MTVWSSGEKERMQGPGRGKRVKHNLIPGKLNKDPVCTWFNLPSGIWDHLTLQVQVLDPFTIAKNYLTLIPSGLSPKYGWLPFYYYKTISHQNPSKLSPKTRMHWFKGLILWCKRQPLNLERCERNSARATPTSPLVKARPSLSSLIVAIPPG